MQDIMYFTIIISIVLFTLPVAFCSPDLDHCFPPQLLTTIRNVFEMCLKCMRTRFSPQWSWLLEMMSKPHVQFHCAIVVYAIWLFANEDLLLLTPPRTGCCCCVVGFNSPTRVHLRCKYWMACSPCGCQSRTEMAGGKIFRSCCSGIQVALVENTVFMCALIRQLSIHGVHVLHQSTSIHFVFMCIYW